MCTIHTNAFKKFSLEDRTLAREGTREGESKRGNIVGVYLRPACFIFKTVNSLWFCNLFFVPVAERPGTRCRSTALRLPAFRRAKELSSLAFSFAHSSIVPLRTLFLFTFSSFFFYPLFSLSPFFRSPTSYHPPPPLFLQISTRPSISCLIFKFCLHAATETAGPLYSSLMFSR